ncbi:InlB B-repeat-containing protein, partial [Aedoeadaptatus coxii]|uniref:InlB B-repeat-containing protein n=1 Tax=Aedoeadaptatus coxii TaxID=755172 RepID=UPI002AD32C9C
MDKKMKLRNGMAVGLALAMSLSSVPYNVFANRASATAAIERVAGSVKSPQVDAASSATYYTKANWDNRIKDKSRWKVEDNQSLVRVSGSDPLEMNDIDYDGMFINANGRYVIRLVYKEKSQAISAVWHRAIINFGDLDQYIDFNNSYVVGRDGETKYKFDPLTGTVGRGFDLRSATGDRTNNRKNLPINLVLKDGVTLDNLPKENFIVQMRITNSDYKKVYAYAPKGTSIDYSTYTKTTSVSLLDKVNNLFIKGGLQSDSNNATNQEFFMSEFIANPDQYKDISNTGIIRTQYMGQRAGSAATPTVGDEPIAFTQVFDANLLNYLKEDDDGYVAYVKVLTDGRVVSPYSKNFGIKRDQINVTKDAEGNELAYLVIGPEDFKKEGVKVVTIPKHDQYTMLSGFYITAIDYVVDKSKFEDTFAGKTAGIDRTRKLNYTMMSGWTNPNPNGWAVYEKPFTENFVVQEGESFMIDAGANAKGKQIMLKVGGEQGMIRKPQGYYNGYNSGKSAIDNFEEIADGVFKIGLREGATVKKGQNLKIYMPYTSSYNGSVNFLQMHNGTKRNEGAATLTLQKDRNINMHLYTGLPRGASFKLKYTLKGETEQKELVFTKPKGLGTFWQYTDSDRVLTGIPNTSLLATAGNFYIDTTKLEPGKDIIVEAYDEKGAKVDDKTSSFKYINIDKANEAVKYLTWTDHSDKKAVLSINKSLYTPYQVLFTNDYADGVDDFYKDPRAFTGTNDDFKKDTTQIVGYTRYDGGKVRTLYEGPKKLFGKVEAASDDYDDKGNLTKDNHTNVTIKRENVFDPQFTGESKTYKGYAYTFDLNKMLPYHSDDKTETKLELLKDMKFVSNASDGSSLPSDLLETRVRARVLFDANTGQWDDGSKKAVKIVPDNVNFYGEDGYKANGFEGANAEEGTGDKFPQAPKLEGKNFLGWVTEDGKNSLGSNTTTVENFNKLPKNQVFNAETPVTKHLVVYAIYSEEKAVTFDANGGKFGDKEQIIVKTDGNAVTAPTENPTKAGYTFKGWASTKNAPEAEANILENVDGSKTVYAVWAKDAEDKLNLTPPTKPVPVQDTTDLTEGEKTKVKDAVKEANTGLNLTNDDITVEKDGKVIVNKDNKTGEIPADQTVTQKEVLNNINPPAKPVEVNNPKALEEGEKDKVKQAIIDANPDLKLTKDDITVDSDGKVTVNKGGKVGEVPAKDTVVETDKVIKLTAPEKVEVKDTNNLTKPEREKVAEAVKAANKTKLSESAVVTVDASGNVTVIDGDKKGTLDADKTIKPFDRTGKTLNDPKELTEVSDKEHLTEAEKQAVREAVKAANPDLAFKNSEIQVADNGKVTVPMGKNESGDPIYKEIAPEKTVKNDDANTTISLKAPKKTFVKDPSSLTQDDKNAVIAAVKAANSSLPADAKIEVANDGSVTVTSGKKVGTLAQADTVVKKLLPPKAATDEDGGIVVAPRDPRTSEIQVTYTDPSGHEQTVNAKKDTDGKWNIDPAVDGVTVNEDSGLISIPTDKIKNETDVKAIAKDGDNTSEGNTVKSEDKQAPAAPEVVKNDDGNITVTPPKDKDAKTVTIKYTDKDGKPKEVKATKGDDGTWTVPAESGLTVENGKIIVPAEKTKPGTKVSASATDGNNNTSSEVDVTTPSMADDNEPNIPAKTTVANPDELTQKEIDAVKDAIEKANQNDSGQSTLPEGTEISVAKDGTATIKYKDGSEDKITGYRLVEKDETKLTVNAPKNKVKVADPTNVSVEEQGKIKEAVKKANPDLNLTDDDITVGKDGTVTVKKDGKEGSLTPAQTVEKDETKLTVNAPKDKVKVADPTNVSVEEQGK